MRFLLTAPFVAFDLETTGIDVEVDRIVTATIAVITPGDSWKVEHETWLADPGIAISAEATQVHGITTEHAQCNGRDLWEVCDEIAGLLAAHIAAERPIVVMNGAYDFTILDRNLRHLDMSSLTERVSGIRPVVDVYVLDKAIDPYRPGGRRLTDLCEHYDVRIDGAHDATADALAAARIAYRMALMGQWPLPKLEGFYWCGGAHGAHERGRRNPKEPAQRMQAIGAADPGRLHGWQRKWRAEQQKSLTSYLRKAGKLRKDAPDCNGEWPIQRAMPREDTP